MAFPCVGHIPPDSETSRPGFSPGFCLAWILSSSSSFSSLLFPLCQGPAVRGFSLTGSGAAVLPSFSLQISHRLEVGPTAAPEIQTPQAVGHKCPSNPPCLYFLISSYYSFNSAVTLHHPSVTPHICHLLLDFLLLYFISSSMSSSPFLSSPPPVLLCQCAESINPISGQISPRKGNTCLGSVQTERRCW